MQDAAAKPKVDLREPLAKLKADLQFAPIKQKTGLREPRQPVQEKTTTHKNAAVQAPQRLSC